MLSLQSELTSNGFRYSGIQRTVCTTALGVSAMPVIIFINVVGCEGGDVLVDDGEDVPVTLVGVDVGVGVEHWE